MSEKSSRRTAIKKFVASSAALAAGTTALSAFTSPEQNDRQLVLKGNINHSVCQWCYGEIPLEDLCKSVKEIGFGAIDLIGPKDWPTLQKYGIYSSMCYHGGTGSLTNGFNNKTYHDQLIRDYTDVIPLMVNAGYKDVICFSGSRGGMDDYTGLQNCVDGLKQILPLAEKNGITVHMELLNSKIDHKDYMCDNHRWGVELCKRLESDNFKLLYDITTCRSMKVM